MRLQWTLLACVALAQGVMAQEIPDKTVDVTVSGKTISANPDTLSALKKHSKFVWTLKTPGYTFAANGIVIEGDGTEYGKCGPHGKSTTAFICKKLKHIDKKRYKYDINLLDASGQAVKLDPIILNE
jgi:hypothetical protein